MILRIGNKGFSLIELLVVVCIISVIAGISLPLFSKTFDNISLEATSQEIVSLMRLASFQAINEGCDYRLYFERDFNRYYLAKKVDSDYKKISNSTGKTKYLPRKIKMETNTKFIDFNFNGQLSPFCIMLKNDTKRFISITNEGNFFNLKIAKG